MAEFWVFQAIFAAESRQRTDLSVILLPCSYKSILLCSYKCNLLQREDLPHILRGHIPE